MKSTIKILFALMAVLLVLAGCEYEVAKPQWEQDHENPPVPVITEMDPAEGAIAGVNAITLIGENFADSLQRNHVYFNNVEAEIIEASSASITVRRPNLESDSSVVNSSVKLVSYDALLVAAYSDPYPVFSVTEQYGNFIENLTLAAITTDQDSNLYVVETTSRNIYKITPDEEKSLVGVAGGTVYDLKMSPSGKLILLFNNKEIHQVDPDAVVDTAVVWTGVKKRVKYGDFNESGNFYAASKSSDLICVKPDLTSRQLGFYSSDEIFCVRVLDNDVYVLVKLKNGEPELGIWKHEILDADGNLGEGQLVLDWAETGDFADVDPTGFDIDAESNIYIAADREENPLMVRYTNGDLDTYYKDIIPGPAKQIIWSTGTHLFMILDGDEKNVLRIDMGVQGAPNFRG